MTDTPDLIKRLRQDLNTSSDDPVVLRSIIIRYEAERREAADALEQVIDRFKKYGQEIQEIIRELEAENERLRRRCEPNKIVMIGDTGHYVNLAIYDEIKRLKQEAEDNYEQGKKAGQGSDD